MTAVQAEGLTVLIQAAPEQVTTLLNGCRSLGEPLDVHFDPDRRQLTARFTALAPVRRQVNALRAALGEHFRAALWDDVDYDEHDTESRVKPLAFLEGMQHFSDDLGDETPLTDDELARRVTLHEEFLQAGGGGGTWSTTSMGPLTFGGYVGPDPGVGQQFSIAFREETALTLDGLNLGYARCNALDCPDFSARNADLTGSLWVDSFLPGADFTSAKLARADFSRSDLTGASFRNADLTATDFEDCDLTGADFTGAVTTNAHWHGATLDNVTGLDRH